MYECWKVVLKNITKILNEFNKYIFFNLIQRPKISKTYFKVTVVLSVPEISGTLVNERNNISK